jgi:hypothetical protein
MMNRKITMAILVMMNFCLAPSVAFAGTGWYMSITNNTKESFKVENSGSDCWYTNDINNDTEVKPGDTVQIYSEMKNSGSCNKFINGGWVQGFKLMGGGNFQNQIFNAEQNGSWDGHFGTCVVAAQAGYQLQGKTVSCGPASSTIKYSISITEDSNTVTGLVTSMDCSGSLSCDLLLTQEKQ